MCGFGFRVLGWGAGCGGSSVEGLGSRIYGGRFTSSSCLVECLFQNQKPEAASFGVDSTYNGLGQTLLFCVRPQP